MAETELKISMLGDFSIQCAESQISDGGNRSHKVWLLLAYLIYCRKRAVTTEELIHLLWSEDDTNTASALKTTLHSVRARLDQLYPGAGHELIINRGGTYAWNTEIPLTLDVEEFETLCKAGTAAEDEEQKLSLWRRALALYQGDFLTKLSSDSWVMPIATYFHSLYVETVLHTLPLLERYAQWESICQLCQRALQLEPYSEKVCRSLMEALFKRGQQQEAVRVYESMSERLLSMFGIMPGDETRILYREIIRTNNSYTISPEDIVGRLQEPSDVRGAMICDYDFFKVIYQFTARLIERNRIEAHLALVTVSGQGKKGLSRRSLDRAVENLLGIIRTGLRRGDVIAQCSASQLVVLLPGANYENSMMVCQRIFNRFYQQYPQSPVRLHSFVQPLESADR